VALDLSLSSFFVEFEGLGSWEVGEIDVSCFLTLFILLKQKISVKYVKVKKNRRKRKKPEG
jgi:hypothetical protein